MVWTYYTMSDGTYSNYPTSANDYFSNMTQSFTTPDTGTIYDQYDQQTYTIPYYMRFIIIEEHYDRNLEHRQGYVQQQPQQPPQKTPEQIKEEDHATERAKNLLLEYLDEDNKQKFLNRKHLEIESKLFRDIKYHIPLSKLGKIKAWKNDNVITELCLSVKEFDQLPTEDIILTKLLHTMYDEVNMLKTANHSNVKENLLIGLN